MCRKGIALFIVPVSKNCLYLNWFTPLSHAVLWSIPSPCMRGAWAFASTHAGRVASAAIAAPAAVRVRNPRRSDCVIDSSNIGSSLRCAVLRPVGAIRGVGRSAPPWPILRLPCEIGSRPGIDVGGDIERVLSGEGPGQVARHVGVDE